MLEEIKEKWDEILLNIKEEHDISEVSYRTWLLPLIPDSVDKDILTILVPDSAFISYVKKKYEFLLKITIEEITGFQCELDFKLKSDVKEPEKEPSDQCNQQYGQSACSPKRELKSALHLRYLCRRKKQQPCPCRIPCSCGIPGRNL